MRTYPQKDVYVNNYYYFYIRLYSKPKPTRREEKPNGDAAKPASGASAAPDKNITADRHGYRLALAARTCLDMPRLVTWRHLSFAACPLASSDAISPRQLHVERLVHPILANLTRSTALHGDITDVSMLQIDASQPLIAHINGLVAPKRLCSWRQGRWRVVILDRKSCLSGSSGRKGGEKPQIWRSGC